MHAIDTSEKIPKTEGKVTGTDTNAISERALVMAQRYTELIERESGRHTALSGTPELDAIRELGPRLGELLTLIKRMRETSDLTAYLSDMPKALRTCYLFSSGTSTNGWAVDDDKQSINDAMEALGRRLDRPGLIDASGACLFVPMTVPYVASSTTCKDKLVVRIGHTTNLGVHDTTCFEVTADGLVVPSAIMRNYPDEKSLTSIYGMFPSRFDAYERAVIDAMSGRIGGLVNGLMYIGKEHH